MEIVCRVTLYITFVIEFLCFFYMIYGCRWTKNTSKFFGLEIVVALGGILASACLDEEPIPYVSALLLATMVVHFDFQLKWKDLVGQSFVMLFWIAILEDSFEFAIDSVWNIGYFRRQIICEWIIIIILCFFFWAVGRKLERDTFILPFWMNCVVAFFLFMMSFMYSFLTELHYSYYKKTEMVVLAIDGVVLFCMFLSLIYFFQEQSKKKLENTTLEEFQKQQQKYYEQLLEKEQSTRAFRHDIINELMQIKFYVQTARYDELGAYVNETLDEINEISKREFDVQNETINVILNHYLIPLKNDCEIAIKGRLPHSLGLSERDLSILVSNLIVNAVEAVEKVSGQKKIEVELKEGNIYSYLMVKNTYLAGTKNQNLETSKKDKKNHGFGLKNVENIIEKYHAKIQFSSSENEFCVQVKAKN